MNNHIVIAGHLGDDPQVRFTSSGQKVTSFRIASNTKRKGNKETIWWRITVWGEALDKIISYLKKGSASIVMGELQKPEIFTDREGNPQISLNVIATNISFSPFGKTERSEGEGAYAMAQHSQTSHQAGSAQNFSAPSQQPMNDPFGHSDNFDPMMKGQGNDFSDPFSDEEIPF